MNARLAVLILLIVFASSSSVAAATLEYRLVNLGALTNGDQSQAHAINERGRIAGWSRLNGRDKPVVWELNEFGDLRSGRADGCVSTVRSVCADLHGRAMDLNDRGEVVGFSETTSARRPLRSPAYWTLLGNTPRTVPSGPRAGWVSAINNAGVSVGQRFDSTQTKPFRVDWHSQRTGWLLSRDTPVHAEALGINDAGFVVGWIETIDRNRKRLPYVKPPQRGLAIVLPQPDVGGTARGISNSGNIVGDAFDALASKQRAVVWKPSEPESGVGWNAPIFLPDPTTGNYRHTWANAVNDIGEAVGGVEWLFRQYGAVLWKNGNFYNLDDFLSPEQRSEWRLLEAFDINERGEIVGTGSRLGQTTAFLLTPIRRITLVDVGEPIAINDASQVLTGGQQQSVVKDGVAMPLRSIGPIRGTAFDIGPLGYVVGTVADESLPISWPPSAAWETFWWFGSDESGRYQYPKGRAHAISASGHVVGAGKDGSFTKAFLGNTMLYPLSYFEPPRTQPARCGPSTTFFGVSSTGNAVGMCTAGIDGRVYKFSDRFGPVMLSVGAGSVGRAVAVNSSDQVVGSIVAANGRDRYGALWSPTGQLELLKIPNLKTGTTFARSINDRGQIVGSFRPNNLTDRAFILDRGAMIDLNLIKPITESRIMTGAVDLNHRGEIVGTFEATTGAPAGFLLTLPSDFDDATAMCGGWCLSSNYCANTAAVFDRPSYGAYGACMSGCVERALRNPTGRTIEQERPIRDCFLFGKADSANPLIQRPLSCDSNVRARERASACCNAVVHGLHSGPIERNCAY